MKMGNNAEASDEMQKDCFVQKEKNEPKYIVFAFCAHRHVCTWKAMCVRARSWQMKNVVLVVSYIQRDTKSIR